MKCLGFLEHNNFFKKYYKLLNFTAGYVLQLLKPNFFLVLRAFFVINSEARHEVSSVSFPPERSLKLVLPKLSQRCRKPKEMATRTVLFK